MPTPSRTGLRQAVDLAKRFVDLTYQAKSSLAAVGQEFDTSMPQLELLHVLSQCDALPMRQLADCLHCEPSNVTGLVDRLEARQLVERQLDPADRRVRRLALTPEGQALVAAVWERLTVVAGFSSMSPEQRRLMGELMDGLAQRWGAPPPG